MKPDIITKDTASHPLLSLGKIPLVNNLNKDFVDSIDCDRFDLSLLYFEKTGLIRLSEIVEPELLFDTYLYYSSVSEPYIEHCKAMYDHINQLLNLNDDLIIDIGGNDGALLDVFRKKNLSLRVINIEPSNIAELSEEKGIKTIKSYLCKLFQNKTIHNNYF